MSLIVGLNKSKQISKWCEYKDAEGNVLAEIKVRGISYKPYQVAVEIQKTFDPTNPIFESLCKPHNMLISTLMDT